MTKPNVIVIAAPGQELPPEFELLEAEANLLVVDTCESLQRAKEDADIAFMWDYQSELINRAGPEGLSWIHINSIGLDALSSPEIANSPVAITNTRGVFEPPLAEFVLAAVLFFAKDIRRTVEFQRAATWCARSTEAIRGRRALVLGPGAVGREIALLLRQVGLEVDVIGRTARDNEPGLGRVHGGRDLDRLLPLADDVILAAPLTDETRGLFNADRLSTMRRGARLYNVGRGPLVDEQALLESLRSGHLAAAALDVFDNEPLDPAHPFWSMENVLVSPHMSGTEIGWERSSVELFLENLRRWTRNEEMKNRVDVRKLAAAEPSE